ncbi:MAG: aldo/keto reductase [Planctomyces sp.]|nr:aldo/keto reductase [Planctomyces sp.]
MLFRPFSNTGLSLSVVGLGTWAIGGGDWKFGWGDQDESDAIGAITAAVEKGINWIDTAAIYGEGRSEELVGKALRQIPVAQRPLIATKCGRVPAGNGEIEKKLKRGSVIAECEGSLKRLGVDCIDLYQLHWPEPDEDIEEAWQTLTDLKQQGKVRYIGVSNHSVQQMQRLQSIHPIVSLQPPYSMIAPEIESEILPWCGANDVSVLCYSPMGKGLLTGSFSRDRVQALSAKDHRSRDPRFNPPQLDINLRFVSSLQAISDALGWTVAELAIAWTLRRPEVTSAIVGARSAKQIEETVTAGDRVLNPDSINAIGRILAERNSELAEVTR